MAIQKTAPLKALHNFKGKVQIVEAEADEKLPHQRTENYLRAIADERQLDCDIMQGAPHSLVNERPAKKYIELLTRWAKSLKS